VSSTFDHEDIGSGAAGLTAANDNDGTLERSADERDDFASTSSVVSDSARISTTTRKIRSRKPPEYVTDDIAEQLPVRLDELLLVGPLIDAVLAKLKLQTANDR
jgi:hypothetical protein